MNRSQALSPKTQNQKPRQRKGRRACRVLLVIVLVLAVILIDNRFRLVTTSYECASPRLPAAFDGYRVVQLSDLHGYQYGENNSRLVQRVADCDPDIITLTGDFIDSADEIPTTADLVSRLVKIAPVYFISGNHDWACRAAAELDEAITEAGAVWLHNSSVTLEKDGAQIILAGVEDPISWAEMLQPDELVEQIRADHPQDYILFLAHRNNYPDLYPDLDIDLLLSGHAHGGIIRLPFVGGLLSTERCFFPKYDKGEFVSGSYHMILSGGLGDSMLPNHSISARFLNNPEVVCVTLRSQQ